MRDLLLAVLLATSVLVAYAGVRQHDFVNFDDPEYVVQNRHVTSGLTGANVAWALTAVHSANWHPLTWMSHMLDCSLYGLEPGGHHVTNVLLHATSAVLLFLALRTMTGAPGRSAFVAALFALHPRNVESVAWISERKDVLSAVFWTGAMWAHAAYAQRSTLPRYLAVALLLALGLLAKPMVVTLPAALLLLDLWPLRRVRLAGIGDDATTDVRTPAPLAVPAVVREYAPLFAIALAAAIVTFLAQRSSGAVATLAALPLGFRLQNAVVTYAGYLWSLLWPTQLAVFYPYRTLPLAEVAAAMAVLIALTALAWRTRRAQPYLLVGWLWYLGTLVPVIGIVKAGDQAMADRFTYLPAIGIFLAATWAIADAASRDSRARRALVPAAVLVALSVLAWRTRRTRPYLLVGWLWYLGTLVPVIGIVKAGDQAMADRFTYLPAIGIFLAATWAIANAASRDPRTRRALVPAAVLVAIACLLTTRRQVEHWRDSVTLFRHALAVTSRNHLAELNLAAALVERGDVAAGLEHARAAQALRPEDVKALATLGTALARSGHGDEAESAYRRALQSDPDSVLAWLGMAVLHAERGQWGDAERAYAEVLRREPEHAKAHAGLGFVLSAQARHADAIAQYRAAIVADDKLLQAYNGLALALEATGQTDEALRVLESALQHAPDEQRLRVTYDAMLQAHGRAPRPR